VCSGLLSNIQNVGNIYIHFEHPENIGHEISFHETSIRQTKTGNAQAPGISEQKPKMLFVKSITEDQSHPTSHGTARCCA
jgi:hypothetical protein